MANLDVSDVLCDPDLVDTGLVCVRSTETLSAGGIASFTPTNQRFAGVVTSDQGKTLERQAAGERVEGSIRIITRFALQDGAAGQTADTVLWRGRTYTVAQVQDYSNFGRGFVQAKCDLLQITG